MSIFSHPLNFRPARNDDGDGMAALIQRIFQDYENCPFLWDEFQELKAPADHYKKLGGELFVLEEQQDDGTAKIVGSLAVTRTHHPETAQLFKVYLAHAHRGNGTASAMLKHGITLARDMKCARIDLWTDTRFKTAHRFYEKHGFRLLPGIRSLHDAGDTFEYGYRLDLDAERAA